MELPVLEPAEVDRCSRARPRHLDLLIVLLQSADPGAGAGGRDRNLAARRQGAAHQSPGHNRSKAGDRKRPIDGQAGAPEIGPGGRPGQDPLERAAQLIESGAGRTGDGNDGSRFERGAPDDADDFVANDLEPGGLDQVVLGQDHHAMLDP